ncbi:uncharacterized protein [Drosophila virilis]|uniref:Uncharacterized protein n=1 Tax=Drosophila virilis TaxID=7244 RepID=A0A0Q9WFW7_DROVI|nr:uncharacterized protein LOC26531140 [Drosophila virilis]KRF83122.1 uncharacterized protein Dvir_GJ26370 [Drosophila virilis]
MEQLPEGDVGNLDLHPLFTPTRLLFYFNKLWELWSTFSCHLITYIERGRGEYFAGFCSFYLCCPQWHWSWLLIGHIEDDDDDDNGDYDDYEHLEYGDENDEQEQRQNFYHLVHMSLIFRASHFNDS